MPTLVELLEPVIDATIQRLNDKVFPPGPIAGPGSAERRPHRVWRFSKSLFNYRQRSELRLWASNAPG
jgi:hypothetical protein